MKRYESKQVRINHSAEDIYNALSNFNNFTPILGDKVDSWQATENSCSFRFKGMDVKLHIVEKEFPKMIKLTGDDSNPMKFNFWMQLVSVGPADTRMRLVLDAELNMMMSMMVGSKLQQAVDTIAEKVAESFNAFQTIPGEMPGVSDITDKSVN